MKRESFASTRSMPLYGIGQGNGSGPAFWLSNLVDMFDTMEKLNVGIKDINPARTMVHKSLGMGFVDDVTIGCSSRSNNEDNDRIEQMENDEEQRVIEDITTMSQKWEIMLHINGGLLNSKNAIGS